MTVGFKARLLAGLMRPQRPWILAVVGGLLLTAGFLAGSHYFGHEMAARRDLEVAITETRQQLEVQRQLLMNSEVAAEVDRQSLEQVRKTVAKLETELLERQKELDLYRNLLKDNGAGNGLYIEAPRITGATGGYTYRIAVRQRAAVLKTIRVAVDVKIMGDLDGKQASYALAELDPSLGRDQMEVIFKYFQVIEGSLRLPLGFVPHQILVTVRQAGGHNKEETFNWSVEKL